MCCNAILHCTVLSLCSASLAVPSGGCQTPRGACLLAYIRNHVSPLLWKKEPKKIFHTEQLPRLTSLVTLRTTSLAPFLYTTRTCSNHTGIDNMGLLDVLSAIVQSFWPSQEQLLQTRTKDAFCATGLLLVPVSQREKIRKMLQEREIPPTQRDKGERILAEMGMY